MCSSPKHRPQRPGSTLEHGEAHQRDHQRWSRRDFLMRFGLTAIGTSFLQSGLPMHAYGGGTLLNHLQGLDTNRTLVLVQLHGGNDGLNTIIPVRNDRYYQLRPTIGIAPEDTFTLNDTFGMYGELQGMEALWNEGRMGVVQGVGYPDPTLSHFRSMDIWSTASDSNEVKSTGWAGSFLEQRYPQFTNDPSPTPLALQIGLPSKLLFQGSQADFGFHFNDLDDLERVVENGQLYDTSDVPASLYGEELAYLRAVANNTVRYPSAIKEAHDAGSNTVTYDGTAFNYQIGLVARLIRGGLGARVYLLSVTGFDTHYSQQTAHGALLQVLSDGVHRFMQDLAADGLDRDVLVMTFSEFGRRVEENASHGTDHGTAAPLLLFGGGLNAGFHGAFPNLDDLDSAGNLKLTTDFRSVYATVLRHWLGLKPYATAQVLGAAYDTLPFISEIASPTASEAPSAPAPAFEFEPGFPNPFTTSTTLRFSLREAMHARLDIFDVQGRRIRTLLDKALPAGRHTVQFDATGLSSGTYLCRLTTPSGTRSQLVNYVR